MTAKQELRIARKEKTRNYIEQEHQKTFIEWFRRQYPKYRKHLTLPSFGENVGIQSMQRLKDMGLTPGWPDIFIGIPLITHNSDKSINDVTCGLFIEMKNEGEKVKEHQKEIHRLLTEQKYKVIVCYNCDEAINETKRYMRSVLDEHKRFNS